MEFKDSPVVVTPFDSLVQKAVQELGPALKNVDVIKLENSCPGGKAGWVSNEDLIKGRPGKQRVIHLCLRDIKNNFQRMYRNEYKMTDPEDQKKMTDLVKTYIRDVVIPHETEHVHQEMQHGGQFGPSSEPGAEKAENWKALEQMGIHKRAHRVVQAFFEKLAKYEIQPKPDPYAILDNGSAVQPLVTLKDEYGGISHIIMDDHCYVLINGSVGTVCSMVYHWYPEAADALSLIIKPMGLKEAADKAKLQEAFGIIKDYIKKNGWDSLKQLLSKIPKLQKKEANLMSALRGLADPKVIAALITIMGAARTSEAGGLFDFIKKNVSGTEQVSNWSQQQDIPDWVKQFEKEQKDESQKSLKITLNGKNYVVGYAELGNARNPNMAKTLADQRAMKAGGGTLEKRYMGLNPSGYQCLYSLFEASNSKEAYDIDKVSNFIDSSHIPGLSYGRSLADTYGQQKRQKCIHCENPADNSIEGIGPLCHKHLEELSKKPGYEWIKKQKIVR